MAHHPKPEHARHEHGDEKPAPGHREPFSFRSFLRSLGPGLIAGAADDDPSGIGTYSQAGAQLGYGIGWTMLLTFPLMAAIQEISARVGRVTGHGISGNVCRHYPSWLLNVVVALLFIANTINIAADLGAMADASKLLIGGSVRSGDDQFYADMNVDLVADTPVRIPTVGPGTRVLSAHTLPETPFQLQRDGAENWFIRASENKRVRLVLQLAIPREIFGSPFAPDATFVSLARFVPRMPQSIRAASGFRVL